MNGLPEGAVSLNQEVAAAHDQMLLLNILRRSRREPMHFTAISQIRDRERVNGSVGLSIPFGGAAAANYNLDPSITAPVACCRFPLHGEIQRQAPPLIAWLS